MQSCTTFEHLLCLLDNSVSIKQLIVKKALVAFSGRRRYRVEWATWSTWMEYMEDRRCLSFAGLHHERALLRKGFQGLKGYVGLVKALTAGLEMMEHR